MRIVQWGYKIPFVTLPPLRLQGQETTYPKGSLSGRLWASQCKSCGTRERSSQLHSPGLLQPIVPCSHCKRGVEADHTICPTSMSSCIARASLWRHLGHLQGPSTGPVVNLPRPERRLLSYRVDPADGTSWQFTVLSFGLSTSLRVFSKYSNLY